jgi:hypothetical protein
VTPCRVFPLVAILVAVPFAAGAQFGGITPGPPAHAADDTTLWPPPSPLPPVCQRFLSLGNETGMLEQAIQAAQQRKASDREMCRFIRVYLAVVTQFTVQIEEHGSTCGAPPGALMRLKDIRAKGAEYGQRLCDAGAQRRWPPGDYWWVDPRGWPPRP